MQCDYTHCNTATINPTLTCIWCNRNFHPQCSLNTQHTPHTPHTSNYIECLFCKPSLPLQLNFTHYRQQHIVTIHNYGHHVNPDLELTKCTSERKYTYPIGYRCSRTFPSYKTPGSHTNITCEIQEIDENYLDINKQCGNKDIFLFNILFQDDPHNPIQILNSLRTLATTIRNRFTTHKHIPSGHSIFALNNLYTQYLISLHVPRASNTSIYSPEDIFEQLSDNNMVDKYIDNQHDNQHNNQHNIQSFIFNTTKHTSTDEITTSNHHNIFDPQKELFNF